MKCTYLILTAFSAQQQLSLIKSAQNLISLITGKSALVISLRSFARNFKSLITHNESAWAMLPQLNSSEIIESQLSDFTSLPNRVRNATADKERQVRSYELSKKIVAFSRTLSVSTEEQFITSFADILETE